LSGKVSALGLAAIRRAEHVPFEPQAANLMFMLVSRCYERASLIVTSNKPFRSWGEVFGDEITAVGMVDRLVHHAEILSLKGDSYVSKTAASGAPLLANTDPRPALGPEAAVSRLPC
jgi:hypothetical protein